MPLHKLHHDSGIVCDAMAKRLKEQNDPSLPSTNTRKMLVTKVYSVSERADERGLIEVSFTDATGPQTAWVREPGHEVVYTNSGW